MARDGYFTTIGCGTCHREPPSRGASANVEDVSAQVLDRAIEPELLGHRDVGHESSEEDFSKASPLPSLPQLSRRRPEPPARDAKQGVSQDWMMGALRYERQEMIGALEVALVKSERRLEASLRGQQAGLIEQLSLRGLGGGHSDIFAKPPAPLLQVPAVEQAATCSSECSSPRLSCVRRSADRRWTAPEKPCANGSPKHARPPLDGSPRHRRTSERLSLRNLSKEVSAREEIALRRSSTNSKPPRKAGAGFFAEPTPLDEQEAADFLESPSKRASSCDSRVSDDAPTPRKRAARKFTEMKDIRASRRDDGETKVFADIGRMKDQLRKNITCKQYNVMDFYKRSGLWQYIARSQLFENVTHVVIAINALWIAIDTDYNKADSLIHSHPLFVFVENLFCVFFSLEVLIRFMAFDRKVNVFMDAWFLFDSVLVIIMVAETWVVSIITLASGATSFMMEDASLIRLIRVLRLSRMLRMARLLRAMPELMILIKGMTVAMRSVFFTLCLLIAIVYIFGVTLTQLASDTDMGEEYFSDVLTSMNTLFLHGTLPDMASFVEDIGEAGWVYRVIILAYILVAGLVVMNMLVGVLVEAVSVVAAVEKEALMVSWVKTRLQSIYQSIDKDGDGLIRRAEFEQLLTNPPATRALLEVGVDVVGLVDFTDLIFPDDRSITFQDLMDVVLQLRGSNTATVKDIVDLRKLLLTELQRYLGDDPNHNPSQSFEATTGSMVFGCHGSLD